MDTQYFKLESGKPVATSAEDYTAWVASGAPEEYSLENEVARQGYTYIVMTAFNGVVTDEGILSRMDLFNTTFEKDDASGRREPQPENYAWPTFAVATDMHHKIVQILTDNPSATPAFLEVIP
ncbi:hypothetical protein DCC81_07205 [Chitinophaga parva]|uniref:Uncharacterized protein n=1 Tax=Chitinophaga parva TaxID=2169414 RepID=A0A2T7BNJ4_9BACT|nr:hypothetical protein [Chitinophaga parva]PUZ29244.1 hypothetical protein DCC81_07205 [Chitinophaga parva]